MKIAAARSESSGQEFQQPVKLQRGLYGGMLARYSAPKLYQKYQSTDTEEKFFVSCVVTHDAAGRELPYFSEAFAGIRTKAFYDSAKGFKSTFVAFWEALMNGKMTPDEIVDAAEANELPDLDDKIGQPIRMFIIPSQKPNKNGILENKIDTQNGGFERPDALFAKAILPLYNTIDKRYSEKSGLMYLAKPTTAFEADIPLEARNAGAGTDDFDPNEVPF